MTRVALFVALAAFLVAVVTAILVNWATQKPAPISSRTTWSLLVVCVILGATLVVHQSRSSDVISGSDKTPTPDPTTTSTTTVAPTTPSVGAAKTTPTPKVKPTKARRPDPPQAPAATKPTASEEPSAQTANAGGAGTTQRLTLRCLAPATITIGAYGEGTVTIRVTGAVTTSGDPGERHLTFSGPAGDYYLSATDMPGGGAQGLWIDSVDPEGTCYNE